MHVRRESYIHFVHKTEREDYMNGNVVDGMLILKLSLEK